MQFFLRFILIYMVVVFVMTIFRTKKMSKQMNEELQMKMDKYSMITVDEFKQLDENSLYEGAAFRVNMKVHRNDGAYSLNEAEKLVYTFDQLMIACTAPRQSINNFFVNHADLLEFAPKVFELIGNGADDYHAAYQYFLKCQEEYNKDIDEVLDDYDNNVEEKNLQDYTDDLKEVFTEPGIGAKMYSYILEHAEEFF